MEKCWKIDSDDQGTRGDQDVCECEEIITGNDDNLQLDAKDAISVERKACQAAGALFAVYIYRIFPNNSRAYYSKTFEKISVREFIWMRVLLNGVC